MTSTYQYLKKNNSEHRIVIEYDKKLEEYNHFWKQYESIEVVEEQVIEQLGIIDIKSFRGLILNTYQVVNKVKFDKESNEGENDLFLQTLLYYFARDTKFLQSPLISKFDGVEINLNKGLFIVGNCGCGKTSLFQSLHTLFIKSQTRDIFIRNTNDKKINLKRFRMYFRYFTANKVVEDYENCQTPADKELFWNTHNVGFNYYDDVSTEREASNFGKLELFKDIFEKRYSHNSRTMLSCNYSGENIDTTLEFFKTRYGNRVYDRLFSMFNIIELKGKSLRK